MTLTQSKAIIDIIYNALNAVTKVRLEARGLYTIVKRLEMFRKIPEQSIVRYVEILSEIEYMIIPTGLSRHVEEVVVMCKYLAGGSITEYLAWWGYVDILISRYMSGGPANPFERYAFDAVVSAEFVFMVPPRGSASPYVMSLHQIAITLRNMILMQERGVVLTPEHYPNIENILSTVDKWTTYGLVTHERRTMIQQELSEVLKRSKCKEND